MQKLLKSYFVRPNGEEHLVIDTCGKQIKTKTDQNGTFNINVDCLVNDAINIYKAGTSAPCTILQDYPIIFKETSGNFEIISDIDDTIMVSHSADFFKRVSTVMFRNPYRRKTISFTRNLFDELRKLDCRFFYVSKSESNLLSIISIFISYNKFPKGNLYLTPYLMFSQLMTNKKNKKFKEETISSIIDESSKSFILVGDDSQQDMDTYFNVVTKYPNRIFRIFIRQTKKHRSNIQKKKWEKLKTAGVGATYFNQDDVFDKNFLRPKT
jgi:phosphatidate phosphatase APP1